MLLIIAHVAYSYSLVVNYIMPKAFVVKIECQFPTTVKNYAVNFIVSH